MIGNWVLNWFYLCATSANSSFQTSFLMLAALGCPPPTPCHSRPFATFDLNSLCLLTHDTL